MTRGEKLRRLFLLRAAALVLTCLLPAQAVWPSAAQAQPAELSAVVDLSFSDAPVAQVFQSLADVAGLNVLVDPDAQGRVTVTLRRVSAQEALDLVSRLTGYGYRIVGNTLVVAPHERLRADFGTVEIAIIPVRHVDLQNAADLVARLYPDADVVPDAATNALIVRGGAEELAEVQRLLAQYDRAPRQPLEFRNAPVESVLWALAERAGWNLVVEGRLEGELTASLEGMDYRQALELVGAAAGLQYRLEGNVLAVRQLPPPAEPQPVRRTAIVRLSHANPPRAGEMVASLYPDLAVLVDEASRLLVMEGQAEQVAAAERFVRELDVSRRQVIVEARLEEIHVDALARLGVSWDERLVVAPTSRNPLVLSVDPSLLRAQLEALQSEGLAKLLASPKLAAVEGEPASILIGDRIPVILQSEDEEGRLTQNVQFFEVGIKLEITATVDDADAVTLAINTEVSSLTGMTAQQLPQVRTREMSTTVRVRDGQALVIGGLIQDMEEETLRALPLLGDLPLVGRLFSRTETSATQTEMVVFLIPYIVRDDDGAETAAAPAVSGGVREEDVQARRWTNAAARLDRLAGEGDVSIAWVDVFSNVEGAFDLLFERRRDDVGLWTGLYYSPHTAWGAGFGWRRYGQEADGIQPWGGLGVEYLRPLWEEEPTYVLSASVGIGTRETSPLRLELFGQYSVVYGGSGALSLGLPGRWEGVRTGLRIGWEY